MSEWRHSVLYNVISGAVKNTVDGHPDWIVPKDFARSVAKRAAGTLAGMNPGAALAAARQSGQQKRIRMMTASVNGLRPIFKGAAHVPMDARLLKFCQYAIEKRIADAKKSGDHARYISLCTAARIVKQELKLMEAQPFSRHQENGGNSPGIPDRSLARCHPAHFLEGSQTAQAKHRQHQLE